MTEPGHAAPEAPLPFRVAFVPGVTPDKWARIWAERVPDVPLELVPVEDDDQLTVLDERRADMAFVRLPVDRPGTSRIPLYEEVPVVVASRDHVVAAFDEVDVADLAGEHLVQDPDLVPEWRDVADEVRDGTRFDVPPMSLEKAIEVVASGTGIVIVAKSLARLHHRKDVVHRPVRGVAGSQVALAWLTETEDARTETFIGIVRGRTARSTRGRESSGGPGKEPASGASGKKPAPDASSRKPAAGASSRKAASGGRGGSPRRARPGVRRGTGRRGKRR